MKRKTTKIKFTVTYQIWYENGNELREMISECRDLARSASIRGRAKPTNAVFINEPAKPKKIKQVSKAKIRDIGAHIAEQKAAGVPFSEARLLPEGMKL